MASKWHHIGWRPTRRPGTRTGPEVIGELRLVKEDTVATWNDGSKIEVVSAEVLVAMAGDRGWVFINRSGTLAQSMPAINDY